MKYSDIKDLINNDMDEVDQVIRSDLNSEVVLIDQISEYIISSGGKRIRPLLCILCYRSLQINNPDNLPLLYKMSAMIEYIHTATLLHDDVVDESGLRRGRQTVNGLFGNAASVLVGDFIYTRAFQLMVLANSIELLKVMANSTNQISSGEVMQLLNIGRSDITEAEYINVIKHKTATLFEACARVAAIISGSTSQVQDSLAQYAINLGNAFQITDDILDYTSDNETLGKNIGDDLLEGKVTMPLIYILEHGNDTTKQIIKSAIDDPKNINVSEIIKIVKNSNAINYSRSIANNFVDIAIKSLEMITDSKYKQALINLAQLSVSREF